jgi:hypothetical protein
MKEIATALVKAQLEMVAPKKGSVNPFFKNKYADLNDVLSAVVPALNNNGIVLLQPLVNIDSKNYVKTVLMHESGETFESLAEIFCNKQNDAQAYGSGISYARRYSLSSICGIGSADDDGQKAVQPKPNATFEVLEKAAKANATIEQIKSKYKVTTEQEAQFLILKSNNND